MPQNPVSYLLSAGAVIVASLYFISAFIHPDRSLAWGRRGRVPMSIRGQKFMGIYVAYFGLIAFLGPNKAFWGMWIVGCIALMVAVYSAYLRDLDDYENSTRGK